MFTDMVDSVGLQGRLGTEAYARLLRQHHRIFSQALKVGAGEVRNDTGDGTLCEFRTPTDAVKSALLFQMFLRDSEWERETPKVRIGIHQGQLEELQMDTLSPGKLVGMPVNIAARVMGLAQPGQILMTRAVYDDARHFVLEHPVAEPGSTSPPRIQWLSHGHYLFKGNEESIEVFEVGATGLAPLTAPPSTEKARSAAEPAVAQPAVGSVTAPFVFSPRPPLVGAILSVLCGLVLWLMPRGNWWVNTSYDYSVLGSTKAITNKVALIMMDDTARGELKQEGRTWDRAMHAALLNHLAKGKCPLVVFDVHFKSPGDSETDAKLAEAMRAQGNVVLMADLDAAKAPGVIADQIVPPYALFANAANWGIANAGVERLGTPRQHWPYDFNLPCPTMPQAAAQAAGAKLGKNLEHRWLRYYGETGGWDTWSYHLALSNSPGYFHDRVVFVGKEPERTDDPSFPEDDKFRTPYTRWTGKAVGGVEIMATTFLNLVNGDWLRRPAWPLEGLLLVVVGTGLSFGFYHCRRRLIAVIAALGAMLFIIFAGFCLSYFTNYWFPWLIIAGAQIPCALAWAIIPTRIQLPETASSPGVGARRGPNNTLVVAPPQPELPDVPEYELITPPIGEGGFGRVWIVRNAIGQWQALKAVYQSKFGQNREPYEAEFKGLQRYKPISEKHPGLLRIELVSRMKNEGYFYYVMELGDAQSPGWERQPALYKPKDLESLRRQAYGRRLPPSECLRIITVLADALNFLHQQGLTHRDIKPSNVIFVNGRPKLADVGLVAAIRPTDQIHTLVGTLGYMPPPPEKPGSPQADIYALGMVLYVISTGRDPSLFPDLSTTLMERSGHAEFVRLNAIILKACQPDLAQRYQTAEEMIRDLHKATAPNGN